MPTPNETTAPAAATPAATTIPSVVLNINGRDIKFKQGRFGRGDDKGKPVFQFDLPDDVDLNTVVALATTLGQAPLAKAFVSKLLRPLAVSASKECAVRSDDGKDWKGDPGKFVTALLEEVSNLTTSAKDVIEDELAVKTDELNKAVEEVLALYMQKKVIPDALSNRVLNLQKEKNVLAEKLKKRSRTAKKDAPAAVPAAA